MNHPDHLKQLLNEPDTNQLTQTIEHHQTHRRRQINQLLQEIVNPTGRYELIILDEHITLKHKDEVITVDLTTHEHHLLTQLAQHIQHMKP